MSMPSLVVVCFKHQHTLVNMLRGYAKLGKCNENADVWGHPAHMSESVTKEVLDKDPAMANTQGAVCMALLFFVAHSVCHIFKVIVCPYL